MKRRLKFWVSMTLALGLMLSMFSSVGAAEAGNEDLKGHWAEQKIKEWVAAGLLKGYEDGSLQPNRAVTRAEFMTLVNRAFDLKEQANITYTDLKEGHWAYAQVAAAVRAGYVKGYEDGTIGWSKEVSREESAVMTAALLKLDLPALPKLEQFVDSESVAAWGKAPVAALAEAGIMNGDKAGKFLPKGKLTRAQAVTLLDGALAYTRKAVAYTEAGTYGPEQGTEVIKGNVEISSADVTLQNLIIEGDLTVTAAVGEGNVHFKKVEVKGQTTIQGGGANSIHFEDSVLVRIVVDKRDGSVRVVVTGATSVQQVIVSSPVKLEESAVTDSGFKNVELAKTLPGGAEVQLLGSFENVNVLSTNVQVKIPSGEIKQLNVDAGAANNQIDLAKDVKVAKLVLDAVAKLLGQGTIQDATVNEGAKGTTFESKPVQTGGAGATTPPPVVIAPPASGGGGDGGGTQPTCPPGPDCSSALLTGISVEGQTLTRLDSNFYALEQSGFDAQAFRYAVIVDRESEDVKLSIKLDKPAHASVNYASFTDVDIYSPRLYDKLGTDGIIEVDLHSEEDLYLDIHVRSGDTKAFKVYEIYLPYKRSIQEAVKFNKHLITSTYEDGTVTKRTEYTLTIGLIEGYRARDNSYLIEWYLSEPEEGQEPIHSCLNSSSSCVVKPELLSEPTGEWYLKIIKGEVTLAEGTYAYDLSPLAELSKDVIEIVPLTQEEISETEVVFEKPFTHGFYWNVNREKLEQILPDVAYMSQGVQPLMVPTSVYPEAPEHDVFKISTNQLHTYSSSPYSGRSIAGDGLDQDISGRNYGIASDSDNKIYDSLYTFIFYDTAKNPLAYVVVPVQFNEEDLPDGVTIVRTWQPEVSPK